MISKNNKFSSITNTATPLYTELFLSLHISHITPTKLLFKTQLKIKIFALINRKETYTSAIHSRLSRIQLLPKRIAPSRGVHGSFTNTEI